MSSSESALRAVRTQVQFELAEAAAGVAREGAKRVEAHEQVVAIERRCDRAAYELRGAMNRALINPALLAAMRGIYLQETEALQDWQARLATAQEREQEARAALADVRNRERSLDRAVRTEQRKRALQEQTREMIDVDELWLQHSRRASS